MLYYLKRLIINPFSLKELPLTPSILLLPLPTAFFSDPLPVMLTMLKTLLLPMLPYISWPLKLYSFINLKNWDFLTKL